MGLEYTIRNCRQFSRNLGLPGKSAFLVRLLRVSAVSLKSLCTAIFSEMAVSQLRLEVFISHARQKAWRMTCRRYASAWDGEVLCARTIKNTGAFRFQEEVSLFLFTRIRGPKNHTAEKSGVQPFRQVFLLRDGKETEKLPLEI